MIYKTARVGLPSGCFCPLWVVFCRDSGIINAMGRGYIDGEKSPHFNPDDLVRYGGKDYYPNQSGILVPQKPLKPRRDDTTNAPPIPHQEKQPHIK